MSSREKIVIGICFIIFICIDLANIFTVIQLNIKSKYQIQEQVIDEISNIKNQDYSYVKNYIKAKKQLNYYSTLIDELKPLAINQINEKGENKLIVEGALVNLHYRTYTNKKDSSKVKKQVLRVTY